jgi:uncharacterized protein (DUF433 family)
MNAIQEIDSHPAICGGEPCIVRTRIPVPVVEELRRLGHDVLTIRETGQANQSLSDELLRTIRAR